MVFSTFAKQVLTIQYKQRPKISFLIRIAKLKFATAMAPLYLIAYGQCPDAARPMPIMLRVNVIVKSFLEVAIR